MPTQSENIMLNLVRKKGLLKAKLPNAHKRLSFNNYCVLSAYFKTGTLKIKTCVESHLIFSQLSEHHSDPHFISEKIAAPDIKITQ